MPDPLVAFEAVSLRSRGGRIVFDRLDWSLPRGARVRIVGERGSGGTAVLRLAAGLAHPGEGRVLLDGVPHHPYQFSHPFLRRGALAWIPADGGLIANLTLLENVALPLRFIEGLGRADAEGRALALLEQLGLAPHAGLRPHALLRHEREMGALARSKAIGAELWLLDRPFADLDRDRLVSERRILEDALATTGTTLLLAGDGPDAASLAPSVVRLKAGRLIAENEI